MQSRSSSRPCDASALRRLVVLSIAFAAGMAGLPVAAQPSSSSLAPPVAMAWPLTENREQAVRCLTDAIVYEAASEPLAGQQAVAQVIMNRTRTPIFPANVCGVVYQGSERRTGCQFSFTCDGSLRRRIPLSYFATARPVAEAAFDGTLPDRVGQALFYHAHYVMPRWAPQLDRVGRIGAHIFYRQQGGGVATARTVIPGGIQGAMPGAVQSSAQGGTPLPASAPPPPNRQFAPWGLPMPAQARPTRVN